MSGITLSDIRFKEYTLENMGLIRRLRENQIRLRPGVCIERARHLTRYLAGHDASKEPPEIRYAKAVYSYLSNKEAHFFDDNLLAGTTTSKAFGAPVYPEYTGMTIWPELDTISARKSNPMKLSREDADELNFDIFPCWMENNIVEYTRKKFGNRKCMNLFERFVFYIAGKAGTISHTIPHYTTALDKGVEFIIEEAAAREARVRDSGSDTDEDIKKVEFYQAVQIAMKGILAYAANLGRKAADLAAHTDDPFRKENFRIMSEICRKVPAKPASTFREAVNAVWIIQVAIHAESINMAMSPGRLDQVFYKYYKDDIANGTLTDREALEIISCFLLKMNDNTNLVPETAEELWGGAGTVPAVTVGGVDENGEDAVNELTYLILRATELLKLRDPNMNARFHYEKNTEEYRDRVAEVIVNTKAVPAFHNDVVDIKTLENQGIKTEHARDFGIIGCVEMGSAGRSYDASSSIIFNLVSALELTLYNGKRPVSGDEVVGIQTGDPATFESFDEFWAAFKKQAGWLIGQAIELNELYGKVHQEIYPTPLLSAFFEGPMEKGKDLIFGGALYNSSGATHIGFADTVDSLNAIEQAVFIEKKCTFAELLQALKDNFKGHEKLHAYLVHKTPKYGRDELVAIKNSHNLVRFIYNFYQGHTNYRGGKYKPAYWTTTNHSGQGKLTGALPNGRKAYKVFASGITPASQAGHNLTECLRMVGGLDGMCIPMGEALNLKFPSVASGGDLKKFAQAVESYFRSGGLHVQFNIMSYEELLDAREHPDKYPELLVRVSGYSAYFKDLNEAMKDEIITRTAYDVKSGEQMPFPEEHKSMKPYE